MEQLGRYQIVSELGRGAMGAVFRAIDPRIDRTVAIKTIAVSVVDSGSGSGSTGDEGLEQYRQRFFREARAAGRLSHPGIVTIFDVDEDAATQTPFIVMEFVDGQALNEVMAAEPGWKMPLESALHLLHQLALALDYAHSQGIVHRDIKPANILVTKDGHAKIADFGIAKASMTDVTLTGQVLGTPAYMSPEQVAGKPIDGRSDLFSLGVIAYWLLTGEKPFAGNSITEISVQVVTKNPRPATELEPSLSPDVDYVLARALAKDPNKRYRRGKEMAGDIQDLLRGRRPYTLASEEPTTVVDTVSEGTAAALLQNSGPASSPAAAVEQARNPQVPADASTKLFTTGPQPAPRRGRTGVFYSLLGAALVLVVVAIFAASYSRALPADLQIVGQYPFRSAEVYVWVDGTQRYHDQLRGAVRAHPKLHEAPVTGGNIAITLPLRAGTHTIRVRVTAPEEAYDRDVSIPGQFRAYTEKTLQMNFKDKNLNLTWDGSN